MPQRPADPREVLHLFRSQLTRADLNALARVGDEFRCPPRWPLIVEGTPAHHLYLIGEGTADVYRCRRRVGQVGVGEVVGELALLSRGLRSATVSTITGLRGVRVAFDRMPELLDLSEGLGWTILTAGLGRAQSSAPSGMVDDRGRTWPGLH